MLRSQRQCTFVLKTFQRKGTAVPCYVTMLLEDAALETKDQSVSDEREFDIKWTANSLYAGMLFSSPEL